MGIRFVDQAYLRRRISGLLASTSLWLRFASLELSWPSGMATADCDRCTPQQEAAVEQASIILPHFFNFAANGKISQLSSDPACPFTGGANEIPGRKNFMT